MRRLILLPLLAATVWAAPATEPALTRAQAEQVRDKSAAAILGKLKESRTPEVEARSITIGDKTLRWLEKEFGNAPAGKRSLWISMHGGGSGPAAMNDGQWQNQIRLYKLKEGIYIAPRAPTDTWNMWHESHIDPLFSRLIEDMIATKGVDPDRVYIMGYSAGGDGVWQLAPRMADRFAAASMMAGHPNEASLLGLRNIPFAIFMGGADGAYDRNKIAEQKGRDLEELQKADPDGYEHLVKIYKGLPHWMDGKDAESIPWMAKHERNPWPKKIVWFQDDVTHDRFYWLDLPAGSAKAGQKIVAEVKGNEITLDGDVPKGITLSLSDKLVNLDSPLKVKVNGKSVFEGKLSRSATTIHASLEARPDVAACAFARLPLDP